MPTPTFHLSQPDGQLGPRDYREPTVVRVCNGDAMIGYAVFGTGYGYVHTTTGGMKIFRRRATAVAVAAEYRNGTRGF
jgi:hypothetical protein